MSAATRGAMAVIDGNVMAINPGEEAKMQMFIWNNIFFSLGFDVKVGYICCNIALIEDTVEMLCLQYYNLLSCLRNHYSQNLMNRIIISNKKIAVKQV